MTDTARSQKNRQIEIATPLGDDKLLLLSMQGSEALGRLFQFELELAAEDTPVDYTKILGQNVSVRLDMLNDKVRYFNGYISRFSFVTLEKLKDDKKVYIYRANLVPWTWFLTRTADCRIFQNLSVPDIIEQIFRDKGFTDFENQLTASYRTWEYCVQYRETDFNFISRLMENEGIYYYFKHENGKHTLILCDAPGAHAPAEDYATIHFDTPDLDTDHDAFLWNFTIGQEITPNTYVITDFNPLDPKAELLRSVNIEHSHDPSTFEIFDYPGAYVTGDEGRNYVNARLQEIEAAYEVAHGTSSARGIFAGATFTLEDHPAYPSAEYLITHATYQLMNDDMGLDLGRGPSGRPTVYQVQVTLIPSGYEYRTPRTTHKPVVQGPQTAIVVTQQGEEITVDKYGRVKVKFHWDRTDVMNEKASCWVRVSQPWAGKKWGAISIPRKGQEVIVEFLEGDPDRPIITGRVYNGENMPPYDLPKNATMTTFKTNSSKGGEGFNEFRFEDKKCEEQIFVHAEKNYDLRVKNDRFETVVNNQHVKVQNNMYIAVAADQHLTVGGNYFVKVDADVHEKISGQEAKEVSGALSLKVGGDVIEEFGSNHSSVVATQLFLKATDIIIQGTSSITIKVEGSSISIGSDGIKLETSGQVEVNGGNQIKATAKKVSISADTSADFKGTAVTVQANGKLALKAAGNIEAKGAVIQLN